MPPFRCQARELDDVTRHDVRGLELCHLAPSTASATRGALFHRCDLDVWTGRMAYPRNMFLVHQHRTADWPLCLVMRSDSG